MTIRRKENGPSMNRRQALLTTGKLLAGLGCLSSLSTASTAPPSEAADSPLLQASQVIGPDRSTDTTGKLRIASCQFPVSANPVENAKYIRGFLDQASKRGAHLLHTSETCLSGHPGGNFAPGQFDWDGIRRENRELRTMAGDLKMWLVLGSAHYLDKNANPTNCLYLINPEGKIVDRYDKCFCTPDEQSYFSAGNHLVTRDIHGVKVGFAICYDICYPQLYIAYRELGVSLMIHSMDNGGAPGESCLNSLNVREVPTRCADNRMWAIVNNQSLPYSHWGSFVARPDTTIAAQLEMNRPGLLIHDFPDGLSSTGWYHNVQPMKKRDDEIMHLGTPSNHPRQLDALSEP